MRLTLTACNSSKLMPCLGRELSRSAPFVPSRGLAVLSRPRGQLFGVPKQAYVGHPQAFAAIGLLGRQPLPGVSPGWDHVPASLDPQDEERMISEVIKYLRETAQMCVSLARACPHRATALGLEEVAADMMAKAKELEVLNLD